MQLLWTSSSPVLAAPSPRQPTAGGGEGGERTGHSAANVLIAFFLAEWFNIHLGKLEMFFKYRILRLPVSKLAGFQWCFLSLAFHPALVLPRLDLTAAFNLCVQH